MNKKTGFNEYIIDGNYAIIKLVKRDGTIFDCIIDKEDLTKVNFIRWHIRYSPCTNYYYATASQYLGMFEGKPKYKTLHMHILVMEVSEEENVLVDHKNHNGLDNRKDNLRITSYLENLKNRKSKNKNNTSGYRNVSWSESYKKWLVQMQINGKNKCLGKFTDLDEAGAYANEMRNKYYGEFKGQG